MNATIERSPRTYWNRCNGRLEKRVFRNGRWVRTDADALALRRLIFGPVPNKLDALQSAGEENLARLTQLAL